jgi:hypothetical protein
LLIDGDIATTTVNADGTTQTYSHPYNPATDPPPQASETTVNRSAAPGPSQALNINTKPLPQINQPQSTHHRNDSAVDIQPNNIQGGGALTRKTTPTQANLLYNAPNSQGETPTGRNRVSPQVSRSENTKTGQNIPLQPEYGDSPNQDSSTPSPVLNEAQQQRQQANDQQLYYHPDGPNELPADEIKPAMPERSERRRSRDGIVAPLSMNSMDHNPRRSDEIVSPSTPVRSKTPNFSRPVGGTSPPNHGPIHSQPTTVHPPPTETVNAPPPSAPANHGSVVAETTSPALRTKSSGQRQSLRSAFKGIRGASDVLRGAVNEGIAHTMRDTAEEERMRAVRMKGIEDWRGSGLSERASDVRDSIGGKERRREKRASFGNEIGIHGSEGPNGLGPVDEVESVHSREDRFN